MSSYLSEDECGVDVRAVVKPSPCNGFGDGGNAKRF